MAPRWRLRFKGPVPAGVLGWIEALVTVLRRAPEGTRVTVEIETEDDLESE